MLSTGLAAAAGLAAATTLYGCVMTVQIDPNKDVGRYWAHLNGVIQTYEQPATYWYEVKESALSDWTWVHRTPRRRFAANSQPTQIRDWVTGLKPGTAYAYRLCGNADGAAVSCSDSSGTLHTFTTKAPTTMKWVIVDPSSPKHLALEGGGRFIPWGNNWDKMHPSRGGYDLLEDRMYTEAGMQEIDVELDKLAASSP
ncbi:MAG TPA: hypothetical protein VI072_07175, partial [Polyangiaceae bacterium]